LSWEEEWEEAHRRSPLRVTPENEPKWQRYWSACAGQYGQEAGGEGSLYARVVQHLVDEGRLRPDDEVLDVGCGPGTYTLPMARRARSVVGLDSASGMVAELMKRASASGLGNVIGRTALFEDTVGESYDLVLSALSPAVRDASGLVRMGRCSRRDCCYITASSGEEMRTRNELWERVVGEFKPSSAYDVKYPLNVLLERGERPDLRFLSARLTLDYDGRELVRNYQVYFEIFTAMDQAKRQAIADYIMERSEDGRFRKQVTRILAVLCWSPGGAVGR
jgi:SAM-dependent methyltransferase